MDSTGGAVARTCSVLYSLSCLNTRPATRASALTCSSSISQKSCPTSFVLTMSPAPTFFYSVSS